MVDNHEFHIVGIIKVSVNHPSQQHMVALLVGSSRVLVIGSTGCAPRRLFGDGGERWLCREIGQIRLEVPKPRFDVIITIPIQQGVARMVVGGMEGSEFSITQAGNHPRVTPRIISINGVGEEFVAQGFAQHPFGGS